MSRITPEEFKALPVAQMLERYCELNPKQEHPPTVYCADGSSIAFKYNDGEVEIGRLRWYTPDKQWSFELPELFGSLKKADVENLGDSTWYGATPLQLTLFVAAHGGVNRERTFRYFDFSVAQTSFFFPEPSAHGEESQRWAGKTEYPHFDSEQPVWLKEHPLPSSNISVEASSSSPPANAD